MGLAQTIALSAGLAWASGLRLYLVVFLAGPMPTASADQAFSQAHS